MYMELLEKAHYRVEMTFASMLMTCIKSRHILRRCEVLAVAHISCSVA